MAKKFPSVIHVTREEENNGEDWLQVHTDGVSSVDEHGTQIAVYQLMEVGTVRVEKSFQKPAKRR